MVEALPNDKLITQVDIAGPGFINVFLAQDARYEVLNTVFSEGDRYGLAKPNSKQKIMVEFVSANPTGPLHVGHGRGAAYGDALARVLTAAGHTVEREYYVNDAGRQMDILAVSVWIRYLQANDLDIELPNNCYKGDYVAAYGKQLASEHANKYAVTLDAYNKAEFKRSDSSALKEMNALSAAELDKKRNELNLSADEFTKKYEKQFLEESLDSRIAFAKAALAHNAAAVILGHNHPSGSPEPSAADKRITERITAALSLLDIRVLDHVIVSTKATFSFAEAGLM